MFGNRLLRCSFCGKDETQVAKLVAGPKVYICDACVTTARQIMDNSGDATPKARPSAWRRLLVRVRQLLSRPDAHRRVLQVSARTAR
jgi:ATP-dependent protease Clp ATPase subunit